MVRFYVFVTFFLEWVMRSRSPTPIIYDAQYLYTLSIILSNYLTCSYHKKNTKPTKSVHIMYYTNDETLDATIISSAGRATS